MSVRLLGKAEGGVCQACHVASLPAVSDAGATLTSLLYLLVASDHVD